MAATDTATQLKEDVSKLMGSYTKLLELCYEALAPEATARQRSELRGALKTYLEQTDDGMAKPKSGG